MGVTRMMHGRTGAGRAMAMVMVLAVLVSSLFAPLSAFAATTSTTSTHLSDASTAGFYKVASAASVYTDIMATWTTDGPTDITSMGTAAGGLGFIDTDYALSGVTYTLSSTSSSNVAQYTAAGLKNANMPGDGSETYGLKYAEFGYAAQYMGFDSVTTSSSTSIGRTVEGALIQAFYNISSIIGNFISGILNVLKQFNPFGLFATFVKDQASKGGLTWENSVSFQNNVFSSAASSSTTGIGGTVMTLLSMVVGWAYQYAIPLFVAFTLVSVLLAMKNGQSFASQTSKFKSLAVRVIFIVAGLVVVGSIYTGVLDTITDTNSTSYGGFADKVIVSSLVDTEGWAKNNFVVTDGMTIKATYADKAGTLEKTDDTVDNMRATVAAINGFPTLFSSTSTANGTSNLYTDITGSSTSSGTISEDSLHTAASSLVSNFVSGKTFSASDYQTYAESSVTSSSDLATFLAIAGDPENYATNLASAGLTGSTTGTQSVKSAGFFTSGTDVSGVTHRSVSAAQEMKDYISKLTDAELKNMTAEDWQKKADELFGTDTTATGIHFLNDADNGSSYPRLSTIGTYNYLNTAFSSSGFNVYSSTKSSNDFTRYSHYSVSLCGPDTFGRIVVFLNVLASLAAFTVIGLVYALGMLFSNLKRGFSLIAHLPFAMMGAIRSIAQVLMLGFMMAIEVVVSMLLYYIAMDIVMAVNSFVVGGSAGTSLANLLPTMTGVMGNIVFGLLGTVLLIASLVMSLRMRGMFVAAAGDMTSKFLESFLLGQGSSTSLMDKSSNVASTLGRGVMVGASAAAMSGGGLGGALRGGAAIAGGAGLAAVASSMAAGGTAAASTATSALSASTSGGAELMGGATSADALGGSASGGSGLGQASSTSGSAADADGGSGSGSGSSAFASSRDADAQSGSASASGGNASGGNASGGSSSGSTSEGGSASGGDSSLTGYGTGVSSSDVSAHSVSGSSGSDATSSAEGSAFFANPFGGASTQTAGYGSSSASASGTGTGSGSSSASGYGTGYGTGSGSGYGSGTGGSSSAQGGNANSVNTAFLNARGATSDKTAVPSASKGGSSELTANNVSQGGVSKESVHGVSGTGSSASASASGRSELGSVNATTGDVNATSASQGGSHNVHASTESGPAGAAGYGANGGAGASGYGANGGAGASGYGANGGAGASGTSGYGANGGAGAAGGSGSAYGASGRGSSGSGTDEFGNRIHGVRGSADSSGSGTRADGTGAGGMETSRRSVSGSSSSGSSSSSSSSSNAAGATSPSVRSSASSSASRHAQALDAARKARAGGGVSRESVDHASASSGSSSSRRGASRGGVERESSGTERRGSGANTASPSRTVGPYTSGEGGDSETV